MIRTILTPNTQTVSFTVPKKYIGKELEVIAFATKEGAEHAIPTALQSPALSGNPLSNKEFTNWIGQAELLPAISLPEAKSKWKNKRKKLLQLTQ